MIPTTPTRRIRAVLQEAGVHALSGDARRRNSERRSVIPRPSRYAVTVRTPRRDGGAVTLISGRPEMFPLPRPAMTALVRLAEEHGARLDTAPTWGGLELAWTEEPG